MCLLIEFPSRYSERSEESVFLYFTDASKTRFRNEFGMTDKIVGSRPNLRSHLLPVVNDKCVNLLNNIVSSAVEPKSIVEKFGT